MEYDLKQVHSYLPTLLSDYRAGKMDRREFLRTSTLLGLSAVSAYALVGGEADADPVTGNPLDMQIAAAGGGTVRISMRCPSIADPATFSWVYDSNIVRQVCDYLTRTGVDNVTRPWLLEKWEASEDLKTWTLHLKKGIKWSNGDELNADHVVWNMKRWVDAAVGSSVLGLFKDMLLTEYDTGQKDDKGNAKLATKLYADNAIEKVDDYTIRLNGKTSTLAVPENLFHYPALILHPSENGKFGAKSIGTGAFTMESYEEGKKAVLKRREGYWGKPVKLDGVEFIDHGDNASAAIAVQAMANMWKLIAVKVKIYVLPSAQYWDIWDKPSAPFAFSVWTHRPLGTMVLGVAYRNSVPWRESHGSNKEFDALLSQA